MYHRIQIQTYSKVTRRFFHNLRHHVLKLLFSIHTGIPPTSTVRRTASTVEKLLNANDGGLQKLGLG